MSKVQRNMRVRYWLFCCRHVNVRATLVARVPWSLMGCWLDCFVWVAMQPEDLSIKGIVKSAAPVKVEVGPIKKVVPCFRIDRNPALKVGAPQICCRRGEPPIPKGITRRLGPRKARKHNARPPFPIALVKAATGTVTADQRLYHFANVCNSPIKNLSFHFAGH